MEEKTTVLSSRDNPLIRRVRRLLSSAKARREERLYVLEGARLCADAAASGVKVEALLYTSRGAQAYPEAFDGAAAAARERYQLAESLMGYAADTETPQGLLCLCEMPALDNRPLSVTIERSGRYLGLEDIQDPSNLGAIIRTAEAFGVNGLLLSDGCCDPYNPKVLRGSMGGVFRLPLLPAGDMAQTASELRGAGLGLYACVPDRSAPSLRETPLVGGTVCLIGNEGNGLKEETIAACSGRLTIPMAGRAESLNAAMAAGIVMWELCSSPAG
ncbi:MAG: RNA methyltransferase [Clostridiales bacterium]|jgi:TrmH family RNA methyltransferase|nr:RNA methyltransferase [Clostridiales bacterium]